MASGKDLSETRVAGISVGAGMQSREEMYTKESAIKTNLFDLVLKRWAVTSEICLRGLGTERCACKIKWECRTAGQKSEKYYIKTL